MYFKFLDKIKEAMTTVLPVSLIIIILSFTPLYNLSLTEIIVFIIVIESLQSVEYFLIIMIMIMEKKLEKKIIVEKNAIFACII